MSDVMCKERQDRRAKSHGVFPDIFRIEGDALGELVIYQSDDGSEVSVRLEGNTIWLTQRQLSDILETSTDNIGLHLKNIYASDELVETATTEDFSVVQQEGQRSVSRKTKHYNLDAIISVDYRVNPKRGTQFRQWATSILRTICFKDGR